MLDPSLLRLARKQASSDKDDDADKPVSIGQHALAGGVSGLSLGILHDLVTGATHGLPLGKTFKRQGLGFIPAGVAAGTTVGLIRHGLHKHRKKHQDDEHEAAETKQHGVDVNSKSAASRWRTDEGTQALNRRLSKEQGPATIIPVPSIERSNQARQAILEGSPFAKRQNLPAVRQATLQQLQNRSGFNPTVIPPLPLAERLQNYKVYQDLPETSKGFGLWDRLQAHLQDIGEQARIRARPGERRYQQALGEAGQSMNKLYNWLKGRFAGGQV